MKSEETILVERLQDIFESTDRGTYSHLCSDLVADFIADLIRWSMENKYEEGKYW